MKAGAVVAADIDAYIAAAPAPVRAVLQRIRAIIHDAAPDATEAIKYGMPTFVQDGNLVHFAAFTHHIGLYPTPSPIKKFAKELAPYVTATGSIQFRLDQSIPYALITRIVRWRIQAHRSALAGKKPTRKTAATTILAAKKPAPPKSVPRKIAGKMPVTKTPLTKTPGTKTPATRNKPDMKSLVSKPGKSTQRRHAS